VDVSVIFSTHDRPASLRAAVKSVLDQTLPPAEIIVVNDGPRPIDESLAAAARQKGIAFREEHLEGPSLTRSRNRGLAMARGEVVLLLEDDVVLEPDYLTRLTALYEADTASVVGGIGATIVEPDSDTWRRRLWEAMAAALGQGRCGPRVNCGRRVRLPRRLAGRLVAARRLSGGGLSLRARVARRERFDERLTGYGWGEDREFCFRVGRREALLRAPELRLRHTPGEGGRGGRADRGRMYVANTLHIARHSADGGAGTWLLAGWDIAGMILLRLLWLPVGRRRGEKIGFICGAVGELARRAAAAIRNVLCG